MKNSQLFMAAAMVCCALTCGAILSTGSTAIAKDGSNACIEGSMAQFGRYVGDLQQQPRTGQVRDENAKDIATFKLCQQQQKS